MANDPVLGVSVIAQAVAPSCSIRNFAADETGHLITVAASSAPSGSVTLSSSTTLFGAVLISTDTTVGLTTTATVSLTTTSVISFSSIPSVAFSTASVIGLTTTSVVGLTTTSVIANSSFTVAGTVAVSSANNVALTSSALYVGTVITSSSNTQSVALTSGNNIALTTTSVLTIPTCVTPTHTTVSVTTASAVALSSNLNRQFASVNNEGPGSVCIAYGTVASSTAYTVGLTSGSYWELPPPPVFVGAISIISATSGGVPVSRFCEVT